MSWDAIGAIGEVVGAVAVIATLLYLSIQIRQNTRNQSASSVQMMVAQTNSINATIVSDAFLREAFLEALNDPDGCTADQQAVAYWLVRNIANNLYLAWALRGLSASQQSLWDAALASHMSVFRTAGGRLWLEKFGIEFGEDFFSIVLEAAGCAVVPLDATLR